MQLPEPEEVTPAEIMETLRAIGVSIAVADRLMQMTDEELKDARKGFVQDGLGGRMLDELQDSAVRLQAMADLVAMAEQRMLALLNE